MVEYAEFYAWHVGDNYPKIFQLMKQEITFLPKCQLTGCDNPVEVLNYAHRLSTACCRNHAVEITSLENFGTRNPAQSSLIINKIKATNLERYGHTQCLLNTEIANKAKKTNLKKYGCENPIQSSEIKNKVRETSLKKYGCDNPAQAQSVKEKMKQTNISRIGYENAMMSDTVKDKSQQTCWARYGVAFTGATQQVIEKRKKTIQTRYGVDHQMFIDEVAEKAFVNASKNAFTKKEYVWKTGEVSTVQGYEIATLRYLENKGFGYGDIISDRKLIPRFEYVFQNKQHKYYPDFFIPEKNLIIEVKSNYFLEKERNQNIEKFKAVTAVGYNFHLDVRNRKGEIIKTDQMWDLYKQTTF
jgi:hypothetical protein